MKKNQKNPDKWMPFNMGDFLSSTTNLSNEEKWAYTMLIWAYWKARHRKTFLKNDKKTLKIIANISTQKLDKILTFFEVVEGNLFHQRCEEEVQEAIENSEKKKTQTEAARLAKLAKTGSVTDTVTEQVTTSDTQTPSPSPIINHDIKHHNHTIAARRSDCDFLNIKNYFEYDEKAMNAAKRAVPGKDVYYYFKIYDDFMVGKQKPSNPIGSFINWFKSYTAKELF